MSNSEEENNNIEKIFNELMSSNSMHQLTAEEDRHQTIKQLLHVQESLAESLLNINSIVYYLVKDTVYVVPESVSELIGPLFKISEDFISHILEISATIEEQEFIEDNEEEDNDGED